MSDEAVKRWLSLIKKPAPSALPIPPTTASSSADRVGASGSTERDDIIDLTIETDKGNQGAEPPAAENTTPVPAFIEEQGPTRALSPIIEKRDSVDRKGKGVKRANPSSTVRDDLKRQKVNEPGVDFYVEKSVDRFVASGPSNDDMKAFLEAHNDMHPVAKRFMDNLDPETLAKEAMRAMVLVSIPFGKFGVHCSMANILTFLLQALEYMVNMCDRGSYAMRFLDGLPKGEAKLTKECMYFKEEARIAKTQLQAAQRSEKKAKAATKTISAKSKEWQDSSKEWERTAENRAIEIKGLQAEVARLQSVESGLRDQDEQHVKEIEELRRSLDDERIASRAEIAKLTSSLQGWREDYNSQQTLLKSAKIDAINWYKGSSYFRDHLSKFAAMFYQSGMEAGVKQMVRKTPGAVELEPDYEVNEGVPFPQFNLADYPDDNLESEISVGTVPVTPSGHKRA